MPEFYKSGLPELILSFACRVGKLVYIALQIDEIMLQSNDLSVVDCHVSNRMIDAAISLQT